MVDDVGPRVSRLVETEVGDDRRSKGVRNDCRGRRPVPTSEKKTESGEIYVCRELTRLNLHVPSISESSTGYSSSSHDLGHPYRLHVR